jgi:2-polyprenyl-6-hydroxyphenyl methylase / 3-demethylubiquinone-9 3-methyltransferase
VNGRNSASVDRAEVERFAAIAAQWWDEDGAFRPLHRLNPTRVEFIRDRLARHFARAVGTRRPFAGLRLLDIGCGGGLICEPLTRLGFEVTGIDADDTALGVARRHAATQGLKIEYRAESVEELARSSVRFDAVLALEVVEHVADQVPFLATAARLVEPRGAFIASTLNRTPAAFATAILGAEYLLRWLPRGTHEFRKFRRPSELAAALRQAGLRLEELAGLRFDPLRGNWHIGPRLDINYLVFATKPARK